MTIPLKSTRTAIVVFFAFLASLTASAQNITPVKSTVKFNNKIRPCLLVNLDPEPKSLKKAWVAFLKDEYEFKLKGMGLFSNKDLLHTDEVTIAKLSAKKMDFYTYIVEDENGSEMKIFASFGYDIYIDEENYPEAFKAMEEMLTTFLKQYLPQYYKKAIDETAERISDLNEEIKDLKEEIKDKTEDIEKLNGEIERDEKSVEEDTQKLRVAEEKLKGRQDKLERVQLALNKL